MFYSKKKYLGLFLIMWLLVTIIKDFNTGQFSFMVLVCSKQIVNSL